MPTGSNRVPPNRTPVRIPHGRGRVKETQQKQEDQEEEEEEDDDDEKEEEEKGQRKEDAVLDGGGTGREMKKRVEKDEEEGWTTGKFHFPCQPCEPRERMTRRGCGEGTLLSHRGGSTCVFDKANWGGPDRDERMEIPVACEKNNDLGKKYFLHHRNSKKYSGGLTYINGPPSLRAWNSRRAEEPLDENSSLSWKELSKNAIEEQNCRCSLARTWPVKWKPKTVFKAQIYVLATLNSVNVSPFRAYTSRWEARTFRVRDSKIERSDRPSLGTARKENAYSASPAVDLHFSTSPNFSTGIQGGNKTNEGEMLRDARKRERERFEKEDEAAEEEKLAGRKIPGEAPP
ncbi:hypothetical protein WN51_10355 [Melipona quadrifasciata]|uniref:Uncharacterized protein n=1 Tax=Melipona quadrifasciata TaxID=166423 RepID=A0A0M9A723_9HYME|nr:hypothetical protein WN51_10355 [Melipona quadrifasciata]